MNSSDGRQVGIADSSDPGKSNIGLSEAIHRRLKNRERQRRYRERKRLRADPSKGWRCNQSSQLQIVSLPVDVPVEQVVTRVHCKRDWKKDARRVHAINQEAKCNGLASSGKSPAGEKQVVHFPSGICETEHTVLSEVPSACVGVSAGMRNSEKVKSKKRDWKAEARNKRNNYPSQNSKL